MSITIEDIAREAGVSKATVSRVMNNTKAVSAELKEKVNQIIEKNNFKPNAFARGLITKKAQTIGVIVPDISNPVNGVLMKGINQICQSEGYTVMISESREKTEKDLLKILEDKNADGIIIISNNRDTSLSHELMNKEYPIVLIGEADKDSNSLSRISYDVYKASMEAADLITSFGHKRIGFIGIKADPDSNKFYEGFHNGLAAKNMIITDSYIQFGEHTLEAGYESMKKIHEENKDLPTAILACSDFIATGAIHYIQSIGLKVPEDISVISIGGLEYTSYLNPALTAIVIPYEEEGIMAAKLLFDKIKGGTKTSNYYIDHKIAERGSLAHCENLSSGKEMEVYLL
ncbi:LacI family transcriptional regulator [Mobilisporobacter senegalensis]|uniref:LacI family transcriptional regulator n=1 Tax=Mobilisporobacter senegalensis TaxID=1329262 RepID=A0A3N1XZ87_9FIRM|nr:LacI family DNA-binding transcriptional regulator [Mobilisporobacter senegalensis]ROR31916.1 LacI family transcriptional regulator [Mobilisporobacter senegalensis]